LPKKAFEPTQASSIMHFLISTDRQWALLSMLCLCQLRSFSLGRCDVEVSHLGVLLSELRAFSRGPIEQLRELNEDW